MNELNKCCLSILDQASVVAHCCLTSRRCRFEPWVSDPWEDPLEKEMATHSNILVWEIPWTEESRGLESIVSEKSQTRLSKQLNSKTTYF